MNIQRREIIKAVLIVAVSAMLAGGGHAMAQPKGAQLWECSKCKAQRWDKSKPSDNGCDRPFKNQQNYHQWQEKR
jgi:high-affinity Fe2+/Pb2+ permease